jgi:hypothetical protein
VCLQLVEGYFGVAEDGKPTPEQWFENARGAADRGQRDQLSRGLPQACKRRKHIWTDGSRKIRLSNEIDRRDGDGRKNSFESPRLIEQVTLRQQGYSCPWTFVIVAELKLKWTSARILGASPTFSRHDKPPRAAKDQI